MTINWEALVYAAVILMAVWGFVKVIMEIAEKFVARHDKEKSWDRTRKEVTEKYDERLNKIDHEIKGIKEEQCLIMEGQLAILEGLGQLNCNGPVTDMRQKLDKFLNKRAHDEEVI